MTRLTFIVFFSLCLASPSNAQKKTTSSLCTRDNAVDIAKQQILITRTFDNPLQRIAVLLRAADLLWPQDQEKSGAAFMEAFDLAVQNFKETGDQLLRLAFDLAPTDPPTAINFARQSFRYPATLQLPIFLYQLARFSQPL